MIKTLAEAKAWIEANKQTDFGIRFVKKDGTIRLMNCQTGVKDDDILVKDSLKSGLDFKKAGLISVYDTDIKEYRCFDPNRLISIRIGTVWYMIPENQGLVVQS